MKKDINHEIPKEFLALFGKPLSLDAAINSKRKTADELIEEAESAKRQDGE